MTTEQQEAEAALLARLQSQFGDMDMNGMISGNTNDDDNNSTSSSHGAVCEKESDDDDGNGKQGNDIVIEDEDDSSLEEPSLEEVMRWQQAQYKLASWAKEEGDDKETNHDENNEDLKDWMHADGPAIIDEESAFFTLKDDPMLESLSSQESDLGGKWKQLYSSNNDGLSYASLVSCIRGYNGPTVLLFGVVPPSSSSSSSSSSLPSSSPEAVIGFYTCAPWRESTLYYGSKNCFLFKWNNDDNEQAAHIYHSIIDNNESTACNKKKKKPSLYQFCNSASVAAIVSDGRKPGQSIIGDYDDNTNNAKAPTGLGAGGGTDIGPRLHIKESLTDCIATSIDGAFEEGSLLPSSNNFSTNYSPNPYLFDIDSMEVWGVGNEECIQSALNARNKDKSFKESSRKKNAKVDRTQFVDHFKSDVVGLKAFAHSEYVDEGVDASCHDR